MLTTLSTEESIPVDHPIRRIRVVVEAVVAELDDAFLNGAHVVPCVV